MLMRNIISFFLTLGFVLALSFGSAPAADEASLMNGEIPLMENATVVKTKIEGQSGLFVLEVSAGLAEVIDYYRQAMAAKGWPPGSVHTIGDMGAIMLQDGNRQFALKAEFKDGVTKARMTLISR